MRPSLPKYRYIWDVELVLKKMKDMPDNKDLSLEELSAKVVTLLGLCSVKRGGELPAVSKKWTNIYSDKIVCSFGTKGKTEHGGKVAKPMTFHKFVGDPKICPVACFGFYIESTQQYRDALETQAIFLGLKDPHKPVKISAIKNWIMKMLSWAGIDTNLFKTHSLRAASTSKVSCWGLQMKDILSNGNWSNEST